MFIQTQDTPNPQTLKFLVGQEILESDQTFDFTKGDDLSASPLVRRLFDIEGVGGVFLGKDFISITKDTDEDWYLLKPALLGIMVEYLTAKMPVYIAPENQPHHQESDDPIIKQIVELIDTRIRPAIAQDGGDIVFESFEEGILYLRLKGACSSCPSSTMTLKSGIENMIRFYVPEVQEVRAA